MTSNANNAGSTELNVCHVSAGICQIFTIVPSKRANAMSSGVIVFRIQKPRTRSSLNTNNMP